jgi:hypothetical protein
MTQDKKKAKDQIAESILDLKSIYNVRPNAYLLRVFMDSKADEIVDVFSDGPRYDTAKLRDDLTRISPLNSTKWDGLK